MIPGCRIVLMVSLFIYLLNIYTQLVCLTLLAWGIRLQDFADKKEDIATEKFTML